MTALEDKMWAERETLRLALREVRQWTGLDPNATHAELLDHLAEQRRQLAQAHVLLDSLRAELDATIAEQPREPALVSLFAEPGPAQQRRPRLALVPTEDPPLELAPDVLREGVAAVPGVEAVSVDSLPGQPHVFMVAARGGSDEDVARAILRAIPQGSVWTAGNTRVEVDGQEVWLARPVPPMVEEPSP